MQSNACGDISAVSFMRIPLASPLTRELSAPDSSADSGTSLASVSATASAFDAQLPSSCRGEGSYPLTADCMFLWNVAMMSKLLSSFPCDGGANAQGK